MKRILAGVALTAAAALLTAAPAQAAPADPVKALKKQFVAGHGVRISETSKMTSDGKSQTSRTTGSLVFGKSGVVASELRNSGKADLLTPPRVITIGGHSYVQGGLFSEDLPEGKKWVRYTGAASGTTQNQIIDIFDSKVLKAIVSKAKSFKGGTYKGSLTYSELSKIYGQKLTGVIGKIKIDYQLSVNSKGLATRLVSGWGMDFGILGKARSTTDTRFTGWGSKVSVKAPPKSQWIEVDDLGADTEVPQSIPENSINSLAG
ncbi:hypothetical protein ITP53_18325 [Nonomuraea sp. K274]|uniref:Lipoprotein n=1 Tax=Nonomuraea cypriaca TaxID=1187855 RepID=A0A931EZK4_9ACTN|nr:hypothetical protein [Nonomuraea cypriaca]MBF8187657.1 hypothetical protein [Nonomuraea cypriaca]